jgi:hypothetical protein
MEKQIANFPGVGPTKVYSEVHESVASMMDFGPALEKSAMRLHDSAIDGHTHDALSWFGAASGLESLRLIREGWADGATKMRAFVSGLQANAPANLKRRRVRADQGDEFDIHRAYSGGLDRAWSTTRRRKSGGTKAVQIAVEAGGLSTVPASTFFWRGAAALVIADALTEAGYSVELWTVAAALYATTGSTAHQCAVKVKAADMPVDIASLAATLCLAGFHRAAIFSRRSMLPESVSSTFGGTTDPDLALAGLEGAYAVPRTRIKDEATANSWIAETIAAIEASGSF